MSDTFDRSQLDGKDREQLSEIASALGVKSISRMRKADLVDAIVAATAGANGASATKTEAPARRKVRSTAAAGTDDLASLADEQNKLATTDDPADSMAMIRRPRPAAANGEGRANGASDTVPPTASVPTEAPASEESSADDASESRDQGQQWRDDEGGNRRRRRRRGRDRDRGGDGGGRPERPERNDEYSGELIDVQGLLDLRDEGYGFLRTSGYVAGRNDAYVSASQVRRFGLRKGDYVKGATRPPASSEKYPALVRVDLINELTPDEARARVRFEDLTKQIVHSIERNNPECHVIVLLVDERPEEVTDMRRHVLRAEVVASTFDRPSEEHTHIAELTIERAKRLVEAGTDVVIILDGITRLARAYNLAAPASGRIMSGGIDAGALYPPKKFFGAARNVEEGGSLTILATALVETNSKMDEHIFEEFKGTGNMELRLDRRTADRRIYPAIDVEQSSTRHEELLFDRRDLQQVWKLRRVLSALEGGSGLELLIDKLRSTKTNTEFLNEIAKAPSGMGT
jgi:transcription termination factor Rho